MKAVLLPTFAATKKPLPKGPATALLDSANISWPGPGLGPTPSPSSGAPPPPRPRPARTLPPDICRTHECKAWDERSIHLMRTSSRVQSYLGKKGSTSFACAPAATQGTKRKRELQEKHSAKRQSSRSAPANAFPAIFARSPALALRFPSLARPP